MLHYKLPGEVGLFVFLVGCATAAPGELVEDDGTFVSPDADLSQRIDAAPGFDGAPMVDAGTTADAATVNSDASPMPDASLPPDGGACTPIVQELLSDGAFDQNSAIWLESSGGGFDLVTDAGTIDGLDAHSGTHVAWLGGYSQTGGSIDSLTQMVQVPADGTPLKVTGQIRIASSEAGVLAWDAMTVDIVNASGTVLESLGTFTNLDVNGAWEGFFFTAQNSFAGQTIGLRFRADCDSSNSTSFLVDTISAQTTACP